MNFGRVIPVTTKPTENRFETNCFGALRTLLRHFGLSRILMGGAGTWLDRSDGFYLRNDLISLLPVDIGHSLLQEEAFNERNEGRNKCPDKHDIEDTQPDGSKIEMVRAYTSQE